MDITQTGLTIIALVLMVAAAILSLLPFVPGHLLLWGISLVYAILTNFQEVTIISMILITGLMLLRATSDFWMPLLGVKSGSLSCAAAFGTIIGGLIGTFTIPIPILGTLLGAVAGAVVMEILRVGDLRLALKAGNFAFRTFVLGMIFEVLINLAIIGVFFSSVAL